MCCEGCFRRFPTGRIHGKPGSISRESHDFRRSQELADPKHDLATVVAALRVTPSHELAGEIGGRLPRQRRVARAAAFATCAMAARAWRDAAPRISGRKQSRRIFGGLSRLPDRQRRIMGRHAIPICRAEPARDPAHLCVLATAVGIGFQLPDKIAGIHAGESGGPGTVTLSPQAVAGETGVLRSSLCAAQSDDLAATREALRRARADGRAAREENAGGRGEAHPVGSHGKGGTCALRSQFPVFGGFRSLSLGAVAAAAFVTAACKPPPEESQFMPLADAARGKQVVERVGCGSCHTIEGVDWPQGRAAPALGGFAQRALIAGRVPNRPDRLAAFIRDAPSVAPGTTMPAMPLSEQESRDVAAYLYQLGD